MADVMPPRRQARKSQVTMMRERSSGDLRADWARVAHEEAEDVLNEIRKMMGAALMLQRVTRRWLARTAPQRAAKAAARKSEEEARWGRLLNPVCSPHSLKAPGFMVHQPLPSL
jgi:hypothetical protein